MCVCVRVRACVCVCMWQLFCETHAAICLLALATQTPVCSRSMQTVQYVLPSAHPAAVQASVQADNALRRNLTSLEYGCW